MKSRLNKLSLKGFIQHRFGAGFTLIELLVVIAVLGVLAAVIVAAINPLAKINQAKDSTVKSDISQIVNALQAYYTNQATPLYPLLAVGLGDLVTKNELKILPSQQAGVTVGCAASPNGTTVPATTYCYVTSIDGTPVNATAGDRAAVFGSKFTGAVGGASPTADYICWDSASLALKNCTSSLARPTQASPTCNASCTSL